MPLSAPVDGFRLAYDRAGDGPPAVLLHGWPGWRGDYRDVVPLLTPQADVVVPDLRGFGESDRHDRPPAEAYSAEAQATSVLELIGELGLDRPVLVGYDVGSRIARMIAATRPDAVRVRVPTTVLWGEHEPLSPPVWSDRLGEFYADFELEILPGVGHFAPLEAPAAVAEATVRALRR